MAEGVQPDEQTVHQPGLRDHPAITRYISPSRCASLTSKWACAWCVGKFLPIASVIAWSGKTVPSILYMLSVATNTLLSPSLKAVGLARGALSATRSALPGCGTHAKDIALVLKPKSKRRAAGTQNIGVRGAKVQECCMGVVVREKELSALSEDC